ncbi:hypothetical protein [Actinophytocola oryzae]|uniref:Uncharacterized protein n=1 Tax=Actinophytocola oryzae TaxID=502181 RepID=A0A4R7V4E1_9PSEU|nr:hypothetical protein [Actinophytocola oryzae]TDV44273.1 hypothetical protein CLV71_114183 [Actinophytocola oryzae]
MRAHISTGALIVVFLGVAASSLLGATLVLGVTGATGACTWTGSIGAVILAIWLVALNGKPRARHEEAVTRPLTRAIQP